jgi:hypothetical protein
VGAEIRIASVFFSLVETRTMHSKWTIEDHTIISVQSERLGSMNMKAYKLALSSKDFACSCGQGWYFVCIYSHQVDVLALGKQYYYSCSYGSTC